MVEEVAVERGDGRAGRAVHEHGVEDVHADDLFLEALRVDLDAVLRQGVLPAGQVDAGAVEDGAGAAGDAHDVDLEAAVALERLLLLRDLGDQAAAHGADAADEQVELLVLGQEEIVVDDVERLAELLAVHDEGDVGLGGALGERDHADAVAAQRGEELARDAGVLLHVLADHGHGGELVAHLDRVDRSAFNLAREGLGEDFLRAGGVAFAHADGDARLGSRLADEEGADLLLGEGGEDAAVHTHDTDHRGTRQGDQGDVVDG